MMNLIPKLECEINYNDYKLVTNFKHLVDGILCHVVGFENNDKY